MGQLKVKLQASNLGGKLSFCSLYWVPVLFQAIVGRKRARTWTRVALSANGGLVTGLLRFGSGAFCGNQGFIIIKKMRSWRQGARCITSPPSSKSGRPRRWSWSKSQDLGANARIGEQMSESYNTTDFITILAATQFLHLGQPDNP